MYERDGSKARAGLAALALFATISAAHAGGFAIREQSAWGQGSSFAGVAAGGSLSTMFWNPATLSQIDGFQFEGVATYIMPTSDVDYSATTLAIPTTDAGDIALDKLVPSGYGAIRVNDRLVLGLGLNAPFGLATAYGDSATIKALGIAGSSDIFSLNVNPAASYQLTDWLAIALGLQVQYLDLRYTAQSIPGLGVSSLSGNDVALGFTAGVLLTPLPGTEIGVGYRSFIDHKLDGTLNSPVAGKLDATGSDFNLPDLVTVGIRQKVTDRLRVMAGAEWSNWSRFDTVNISAPSVGATVPLTFDYQDGWFFSGGAEFDLTPKLTMRAGVGYELSPIKDSTRTFRLPDSNRLWLSAGATYSPNKRWSFDAAYSYLSAKDANILSATGGGPSVNGPFSGGANSHVHIVSAGFKVKLGKLP